MIRIGVTEMGDAALDQSWRETMIQKKVTAVILITKAPSKVGEIPANAIVHATITGYGGSRLEPYVNDPKIELAAYDALVDQFGGERIVLRIDPIAPTNVGMHKPLRVFTRKRGRVRISFMDIYPNVRKRLLAEGIDNLPKSLHWGEDMRKKAALKFPDAEICAEPGLPCVGCVSARDFNALGLDEFLLSGDFKKQRHACNCVVEKVELLSKPEPCAHSCLYCYWSKPQ